MSEKVGDRLSVSRRSFMKWTAALGAVATTGCGVFDDDSNSSSTKNADRRSLFSYDRLVWNSCNVNCGSRCPLRLYVRDGQVVRVNTDNESPDEYGKLGKNYQMRSCLRGRTVRQRIYNPTRIKYPMKRKAGTLRGEGKYERISWEEAINEIAGKIQQVKQKWGNEGLYIQYATGQLGGSVSKSWHPYSSAFARLLNIYGGYLKHYSTYSTGQISENLKLLTGSSYSNNEVTDLINSKTIVLFGNNPANTRMSGSAYIYHLTKMKEKSGAKVIVIDPHMNDTAVALADEWVPIRPGTDVALVHGIAHYMISNGLIDEKYMSKYCVGYDEASMSNIVEPESGNGVPTGDEPAIPANSSYKSYILGMGADGVAKTPAWASKITGIPESKIKSLAKELSDSGRPSAITQGWGPQRHSLGGNQSRAISLLAILTRNIGIAGGGSGARENNGGVGFNMPSSLPNKSEKDKVTHYISFYTWYQAIKDYSVMTDKSWGVRGGEKLKAPIKFIWNYAGNCMVNQHGDINETHEIYKNEDPDDPLMIVTCDNYWTASALVSDIVLPGTTNFEEIDVVFGGGAHTGYVLCDTPAIKPLFEAKPVYEICTMIAEKLGIESEFTEGRTQEKWVEWMFNTGKDNGETDLPATFEEFKNAGVIKKTKDTAPFIAYKDFIDDPENNPVNTPSGKFEIFSKRLYNVSYQWSADHLGEDNKITALPEWYAAWNGVEDPKKSKYPFQVIGHHYKQRTHSTYGNVEWTEQSAVQYAWVNSVDALNLGIKNGDNVIIYNDRGQIKIPAKVTSRIAPGVISVPQGAWYKPSVRAATNLGSPFNIDHGGNVNVLSSIRPTPYSKGNGQHSILANIKRAI